MSGYVSERTVLARVENELRRALTKFPAFNSPHEGYAVIREELERELWAHVCENTGRSDEAMAEAIQIAAMAARYVLDLSAPAAGAVPGETQRPERPETP